MSIRKFETLTPRGKAVRVAKDVLAQLDAKKFVAESGAYFRYTAANGGYFDGIPYDSVKKDVAKALKCEVCAIGAAFVSTCNLNGDFEGFYSSRRSMVEHCAGIFSEKQLDLMEIAFEKWSHTKEQGGDTDKVAAFELGMKYLDDEQRLRAIMQNIIDNRGVFRP